MAKVCKTWHLDDSLQLSVPSLGRLGISTGSILGLSRTMTRLETTRSQRRYDDMLFVYCCIMLIDYRFIRISSQQLSQSWPSRLVSRSG